MKPERKKKKKELVVSLHYDLRRVFWRKMFCVFLSFCAVKKQKEKKDVCRKFSGFFWFLFAKKTNKGFSVVFVLREAKVISVDPVSVMYVCLIRNLSLDGV